MEKCELRRDPLTGHWTLFSEARRTRPAFGSVLQEPPMPDAFLAGLERFSPHTLYAEPQPEWEVRVVPNRTPVLRIEGDAELHGSGLYDRMDGVGAHEVVIEDPDRRPLEELDVPRIQRVIDTWKTRMLDLQRDPRMRSFLVIKNVGLPAGAHSHHAISQLVAMALVFPTLKRKLQSARAFFQARKHSLFEAILQEESRADTRYVYENNGFALLCPYAARSPFEMLLLPKRQCPDFHALSEQESVQMADCLQVGLRKLVHGLNHPAYNLMLFTAPTRTPRKDAWTTLEKDFRWHLEILPRLDHLGGMEMATGCWINGVWPEVAAEYLRNVEIAQ